MWKSTQTSIETTSEKPYPFDVLYLNLDRNSYRAKHMEKLLDFVGLTYHTRIRGVNGDDLYSDPLYLNEFKYSKGIKFNFEMHKKQVTREGTSYRTGNWLSFLFLFKELASRSSNQPFLILEDDIDMEADFPRLLLQSIQVAPIDWEILLCGHSVLQIMENKKIPPASSEFWLPAIYFVTLHCFVVRNSTTAARIAGQLDRTVFDSATDLVITSLIQSHNLVVYGARHQIAAQRRDLFGTNSKVHPGNINEVKLSKSAIDLMKIDS